MKTSFLQTGISTAALSLSAVAAFAADGRPNISCPTTILSRPSVYTPQY